MYMFIYRERSRTRNALIWGDDSDAFKDLQGSYVFRLGSKVMPMHLYIICICFQSIDIYIYIYRD